MCMDHTIDPVSNGYGPIYTYIVSLLGTHWKIHENFMGACLISSLSTVLLGQARIPSQPTRLVCLLAHPGAYAGKIRVVGVGEPKRLAVRASFLCFTPRGGEAREGAADNQIRPK
jgi:hypothetical protein